MDKTLTKGSHLKLIDVSKTFGNHTVLSALDLEITEGEFIAIVGRSGCGKSTLLRLMTGLEPATTGGILVDGIPLNKLNTSARVMFQDARLLLWKRVIENVGLGLEGHWKSKALWALQQVGLAERANDWVSVLSGGQRQRVALARALVSEPKLLLLDEPLGALDALTRIEMQRLIEFLWLEKGFTTVLITHDIEEAVTLADRLILLEGGKVAMDLPITLPRPRSRGDVVFASLVERILERVLHSKQFVFSDIQ